MCILQLKSISAFPVVKAAQELEFFLCAGWAEAGSFRSRFAYSQIISARALALC